MALVLARKVDEEVVIDGTVRVKVLEINGNKVRLAITAPDNVTIRRGEVALSIAEYQAERPQLNVVRKAS